MKQLRILLCFVLVLSAVVPMLSSVSFAADENIIKGLPYNITTGVSITGSYLKSDNNGSENAYILTDGKNGGTKFDGKYAQWLRGYSRIIEFDLGEEHILSGFKATFLHGKSAGVYIPRYVKVYVANDSSEYRLWASADAPFKQSDVATKRGAFNYSDKNEISARYVRFEINVDIHVYCDEIQLFGKKGSGKACTGEIYSVPEGEYFEKYSDSIGGVGDIIKMYNGRYEENGVDLVEMGDNTVEELIPYVAYVDTDGEYLDTMFDAVAFVPIHSAYPSGGRLTLTNGYDGAVMTDWLMYLDNTFKEGVNADALDEAVETVYSKLGKKEKLKVFFTMPYPTVLSGKMFGDIDGDGKPEACSGLSDRVKIIKWYTDLTIERFNQKNYKNLELEGFYWYREEVNQSNTPDEVELVKQSSDYIHSLDKSLLFDPFWLSLGCDEYKDFGFDCAFMQPNYCFYETFDEVTLKEFAESAKRFNTGCEIEVVEPWPFSQNSSNEGLVFQKYLYYGAKYGYMNTAHTYYQGAGPGTFYDMAKSDDMYVRSLYDDLYEFIKGTYKYTDIDVKTTVFTGEGKIKETLDLVRDTNSKQLTSTVVKAPENGKVTLSGDMFLYTPNEGFTGTDIFVISLKDSVCEATEHTITVNITGDAEESATSEPASASKPVSVSSQAEDEDGGYTLVIVIAAVIIVAVAVVLVLVNRKGKKE